MSIAEEEVYAPVEKLTRTEEKIEKLRKSVGIFLGPLVFFLLLFFFLVYISCLAHILFVFLVLVFFYFITEAIPLPVTALLGPVLCVVLGVEKDSVVFAPFANPIIFLFLGSFMIAEAMKLHNLDRRIAFWILGLIGSSTAKIVFGIALLSFLISMWISNTATTAMLFPIALGILNSIRRSEGKASSNLSIKIMLIVAYAASVGGIATPVGTPPNLIGMGMIDQILKIKIGFFNWMLFALPISFLTLIFLLGLMSILHRTGKSNLADLKNYLVLQRQKLGKISLAELHTLVAFFIAIFLWTLPGFLALLQGTRHPALEKYNRYFPEAVVALVAALILFLIPHNWKERKFTLSWKEAVRIDWGTIILFGGGLSLGSLMFSTGLAEHLGQTVISFTRADSVWSLTFWGILIAIVLSETTSNTASASMVIPVMIAVAQAANINPLPPALGACLGASFGFMLPVSTPPNAIVYGSGLIPITKMVRAGILLDITGLFIIWLGLRILCPLLGWV